MTDRKRDPLPEGYQFGDAGRPTTVRGRSGAMFLFDDPELAARFADLCADSEIQAAFTKGWNVIEGEHFATDYGTTDYRNDYGTPFTTDRDPGDETPT